MVKSAECPSRDDAVVRSRAFLTQALRIIDTPLVVDARLALIADVIADYLQVDDVSIFLTESDSDTLVLRVSSVLPASAIGNLRVPLGKGITGLVAQTRQYIASRNILKDPRNFYSVYAEDEKFPSVLSFPILHGDELIGTVNIRTREERDFTDKEARELSDFTQSIAGSIKNARQYEDLAYRARLLELTLAVAGSISGSLELAVLLEDIAWEIAHGFGVRGVLIHLFDSSGNLSKTASSGLKASFVRTFPLDPVLDCMHGQAARVRRDEDASPFGPGEGEVWSIMLPLKGSKQPLGAITLIHQEEPAISTPALLFSLGLEVLLHIATLSALAIENATIYSEVIRLSDDVQHKLEVIETLYARMTATFDAIDSGVISVDGDGVIRHFNTVAGKALGLSAETKGSVSIGTVTSYKPSLPELIAQGRELTNRVVTFHGPNGDFAAVVTMRMFAGAAGDQRGTVISFRPMEETVKLLSRFSSQRPRFTFDDIIGNTTTLAETVRLAKLAAQTNSTVLVIGESGTGKELFSQSIHNASPVAEGPFIPVNCAAIPKDLIESELFGYAEGAFTGARKGGYIGKFEQATGGTIFLDEIGDMPVDVQVKLLRVLQEKMIQRVGSEHLIPVSARVIAATNRDLRQAIQDGGFREELYWRLNVLTIELPSLRERLTDIPEFVRVFIEKYSRANSRTIRTVDPAVMQRFMEYTWKGNVRQLENTIEHAILVATQDRITLKDLPQELLADMSDEAGGKGGNLEQARADRAESSRRLYREAIIRAGGDVDAAAVQLGMSRATIYRRLRKYNLVDLPSEVRRTINNDSNDI